MMYTLSCSYIYSPELKDQQHRDSLGKLTDMLDGALHRTLTDDVHTLLLVFIYSPELKDQQHRDSLGKLMQGYFLPFKRLNITCLMPFTFVFLLY